MIGELEHELRRLLRGLDGQTAIYLGCFGVLLAQIIWVSFKGPLPVPSTLPLFTGLAATLAAHSYFLSQRGLLLWLNAIDLRLGPGSGFALLESAMLKAPGESVERGFMPGAGEFRSERGDSKLPALMRRARGLAWFAPAALGLSALVFSFQGLQGAAIACGLGTLINSVEALNLQQMMKTA